MIKKAGKFLVVACSAALALTLAACNNPAPTDGGSDAGSAVEGSAEGSGSAVVGMPNPWSDVAAADEAAEIAGVGYFTVPEGTEIAPGPIKVETYSAMEGLAEAYVPYPAVDMTIRKGLNQDGDDVSGDYNVYAHEWATEIDGFNVVCFGNREGEATKTIWTSDNFAYSVVVRGLGGDTDYGLSAEDVATLVKGVQ